MKQHYNRLSDNRYIYDRAVLKCFKDKWRRNDVLSFIEKYAGIPRHEILLYELEIMEDKESRQDHRTILEAVESSGLALEEVITQILDGQRPYIDPVRVRKRPDGMTGKIRDIALLSIMHQLTQHTVYLLMEPLFKARLYQTQHASIPGGGQTRLKNQVHKYLRSSLPVSYAQKTDMEQAYKSLTYKKVIELVKKDIPSAREIITLLEFLGELAPDGHLIIGGYLDAWLFNYAMSNALRYAYTLGQTRRGKFERYAKRLVTFMDDLLILTSSVKAAKRLTDKIRSFAGKALGMTLKITTGILKLLPAKEEKRRRGEKSKAARGCPVIDMAGYKICRSHVMIRRRVFIRVRRQLLRGWKDLQRTGTLSLQRAHEIIARNGFLEQSDSKYVKNKYHVAKLLDVATRVISFHNRLVHRKRMEKLYDLRKRTVQYITGLGDNRGTAGWPAESHPYKKCLRRTGRRTEAIPVRRGNLLYAG